MEKILFTIFLLFLSGCATTQGVYDSQTGRYTRGVAVDMVTPTAVGINTGVGAVVGCGAGALLGVAVGDPAGGCALGAVAGGVIGATSTREETFVTQGGQQGYSSAPSSCTTEYDNALRQIIATASLRRREGANYRITGDQNGAIRIEQDINAWESNSTQAIRVQYQNCITQLRVEPQEQQYVPQAPVYSSRPVFPQPYPQYYNYEYPYRGYFGGQGHYPYYQW
jgi:hypothetical protein